MADDSSDWYQANADVSNNPRSLVASPAKLKAMRSPGESFMRLAA